MTGNHDCVKWTTEQDDELRRLWGTMATAKIGEQMGKSRSAIMGRSWRLKLPNQKHRQQERAAEAQGRTYPSPEKPKRLPKPVASVSAPKPQRGPPGAPHEAWHAVPDSAWAPLAASRPVPLLELGPGQCRWPCYADGQLKVFCGAPATMPHLWCFAHYRQGTRRSA